MRFATIWLCSLCFLLSIPYSSVAQNEVEVDSIKQLLISVEDDSTHFELLNTVISLVAWSETALAIQYAKRFDSLALANGSISKQAHAKKLLGICYYIYEDYDSSVAAYISSIKTYEQLKDTFNTGMIYNNIGSVYDVQEEHQKALHYYEKARTFFDATEDIEWQALILQNIASQYVHMNQFEEALAYQLKALSIYQQPEVQQDAYQALYRNRLCTILANISEVLTKLNRWKEAIEYGKQAIHLYELETDINLHCKILHALGYAYFNAKEYQLAEEYLLQLLQKSNTSITSNYRKTGLEKLVQLYEARNNYKQAFQYQKEYSILQDTMYEKRLKAKNQALLTQFETEKKEQEIEILNAENEVQLLQLAKSRQQKTIYTIGILSLVAIVSILFYLFRSKQRQSDQLAHQNQIIAQTLQEKESLLREIHHRVKNNLQVISSLLSLQERRLNEPESKAAFKASQNRVKSMALIHQNLYKHDDLAKIDIKQYLEDLSTQILHSYQLDQEKVDLKLEVAKIDLDVENVIPMGLIVNELICNALKHAFAEQQKAEIKVKFQEANRNWILAVEDNGTGMETEMIQSNSFGLKLVKIFAQKLKSQMEIIHQNGTIVRLNIPKKQILTQNI